MGGGKGGREGVEQIGNRVNLLTIRNPFLIPDENLHSLSSGMVSIQRKDDVNCERSEDIGKKIQAALDNTAYNNASIK